MIHAVTALALFAAPVIGTAVLVYILVRSLVHFRHADSGRTYVVLKALASLAVWFLASWGWLFMFFAIAFRAGPLSNMEEETGDAVSILILDLLYALIGLVLALWVHHKSEK
jgi:hypothetical protein